MQDILVESMEQARHPVTLSSLDDILYRTSAWQKTLKSSRSPASLQLSLVKLQDIVEAIVVGFQIVYLWVVRKIHNFCQGWHGSHRG